MNVRDKLFELQDLKYKEFHSRLCPNNDNIIGIRIPILRKLAKELYKEDKNILTKIDDKYYEEVMLQGLIIALSTESVDKKLFLIKKFIPKIDNWAVCDIFCSSIKIKKNEKEEYYNFIKKYCNSKKEFELRFLLIMLLDHYLEEDYLDDIYSIIKSIKSDKYYVNMAIAWLLSISYIKYPKYTLSNLDSLSLDKWTYNKTLQKIIESRRVSSEERDILRKLKK